jgi:hypothetical protein
MKSFKCSSLTAHLVFLFGIGLSVPNFMETASAQTTGLLFTPLAPCRIVDTRSSYGALQNGVPLAIKVNTGGATTNYSGQGGSSTGCGIPADAKSVFFNFVVVSPTSSGFFQAWPVGSAIPTASISNFTNYPGLNIANGIAVPVCLTSCSAGDLNIQVSQANAQLVIDVVGYFK